ncbi:MAG: hypothetical protein RI953_1126 [Pseudomonadota bacterium]|jgi:hypothetical protein
MNDGRQNENEETNFPSIPSRKNDFFFSDVEILRPIWDHAFKGIFLNRTELTRNFLIAFIDFESPINKLRFLSSDLPAQSHDGRAVRLDVAVQLQNGTLVNIEMQTSISSGYLRRCVLYNSMLLVTNTRAQGARRRNPDITAGNTANDKPLEDGSFALQPAMLSQPNVISLTLLNDRLPKKPANKFRHSYQLRDGDDFLDKDCFRIDVIELPKLKENLGRLRKAEREWIEFFLADSYAEARRIAESNTDIAQACEVLEMMSKDEQKKALAREIWQGEFAKRNAEYLDGLERKKRQEEDKRRAEEDKRLAEQREQIGVQKEQLAVKERRLAEEEMRVAEEKRQVAEERSKIIEANSKIAEAHSLAVCALFDAGLTPAAIAAQLRLHEDTVRQILEQAGK